MNISKDVRLKIASMAHLAWYEDTKSYKRIKSKILSPYQIFCKFYIKIAGYIGPYCLYLE